MRIKYPILLLFLILFCYSNSFSKEYSHCGKIIIDGDYDDWDSVPSIQDSINDANGGIDLLEMKLSQDDNYIFIYLKFNSEFNLQENNSINLYIDCDNNSNTGEKFREIGADLIWKFGDRQATFYKDNNTFYFKHSILDLCGLPSVTSKEFELSLSKNCLYNNQKVFTSDKIKLALSTGVNNDIFPDIGIDNVTFLFTQCDQTPLIPIEIEKEKSEFLRLSCWNVLQDNLSNSSLTNIFQRIIKTYQPDIQGFEELYNTSENFVQNFINLSFPGQTWYVKKQQNTDVVLCSRYPILQSLPINGNAAFLVDLKEKYGKKALIIVAHLPASQENTQRLSEIQNIIDFITLVKSGKSSLILEKNSPIFIIGDMNLVGFSEQLKLLLSGITNGTGTIDWDSTSFLESNPRLTEAPFCYTWTKSYSYYWPGKLDYIIYSDFSASLKKSFTINTSKMSYSNIAKYNLNKDDSQNAADHLPIISDFEILNQNNVPAKENQKDVYFARNTSELLNNTEYDYNLSLYDILSNRILEQKFVSQSSISLGFIPNGVYFAVIKNNSEVFLLKILK